MTMTKQEMFNKVCAGLAGQGFERSRQTEVDADFGCRPRCLYRGPEGRKCAIGHLLPDELCDMGMNAASLYDLTTAYHGAELAKVVKALPFDTEDLTDLQAAHDRSETPGEMRNNLRNFAVRHRLEMPACIQESDRNTTVTAAGAAQ